MSRLFPLSDDQVKELESMGVYWDEVRRREDKSPLDFELNQVVRMLGPQILSLIQWSIEREKRDEA